VRYPIWIEPVGRGRDVLAGLIIRVRHFVCYSLVSVGSCCSSCEERKYLV
jgi:hypothetical protein